MKYERDGLAFLPIRPNDNFASRLANLFDVPDLDALVKNTTYSNGEYCPKIADILTHKNGQKILSGRKACIVHSYTKSGLNNTEAFARIIFLSDAAYRAGAQEVYLILAENLFDRQDLDPSLRYDDDFDSFTQGRKRKIIKMEGQPFSLRATVRHFHLEGIKKVLTLDTHSQATGRVYERVYKCSPENVLYNLDPIPIFVSHLLSCDINLGENGNNLVLIAPDKGAKEAVNDFYRLLNLKDASRIFCDKYREMPNDPARLEAVIESRSENFNGTKDKILIAIDDKGDTLGTLQKTLVQGLTKDGKPKQIHAMLSHAILSTRGAYELIDNNKMNIHTSNSHPNIVFKKDEPGFNNLSVLDFTPYFAWALVNHIIPGKPLPKPIENLAEYKELYSLIKKGAFVDF